MLRERRFARAVAAQDTNEFAVGDMQIDASQHEALAIVGESNVGAIDHNRVLHKHVWPLHCNGQRLGRRRYSETRP